MSESEERKRIVFARRDEASGTAGLERTSGTTSTSTGAFERTGVAPAMPDTGNLLYGFAKRMDQRLGSIL